MEGENEDIKPNFCVPKKTTRKRQPVDTAGRIYGRGLT